jgi:hypothetical protein
MVEMRNTYTILIGKLRSSSSVWSSRCELYIYAIYLFILCLFYDSFSLSVANWKECGRCDLIYVALKPFAQRSLEKSLQTWVSMAGQVRDLEPGPT